MMFAEGCAGAAGTVATTASPIAAACFGLEPIDERAHAAYTLDGCGPRQRRVANREAR